MPARLAICAGVMALLAACDTATTQSGPARTALAQSATASPGPAPVDAARAAALFDALCVKTAPTFAQTPARAASNGFVQNTQFGTFYHARDDLSVKLTNNGCSMVFASSETLAALQAAFGSLDSGERSVTLSDGTPIGQTEYYRAFVSGA